MAAVIAEGDVYTLLIGDLVGGFVHLAGAEIVALFVDPAQQGQSYGRQLLRFAQDQIEHRPIVLKSTLNAVAFYARFGFREVATESVRRHGHDIYVVRMELT
jgi:ribosomal protein S18 acetylase RimI-like enzyme